MTYGGNGLLKEERKKRPFSLLRKKEGKSIKERDRSLYLMVVVGHAVHKEGEKEETLPFRRKGEK